MRAKTYLHIFAVIGFVLFFLFAGESDCISTLSTNGDFSQEFYYFNPDSPQSNLGRLKQEFDEYFIDKSVSLNFQPFTHFVDFHRQNSQRRPSFIIVPEWYYRRYGTELGLHAILIPVRNGSTSYRKILLASRVSAAAQNDYDIISFAMTTMGPESESTFIKDLLAGELIGIQQVNIINVPKDLDAILALVLGQVRMALVAQDNLQAVSDVNPRISQAIKKLDASVTVSMPVLCYQEGRVAAGDIEKIIAIFKRMRDEQPRNKIMEMLQIDDWQKFTQ